MEMEPGKLVVQCSPNTFRRMQTDAEYRNKLTGELVKARQLETNDFVPISVVLRQGPTQEDAEEDSFMAALSPDELGDVPLEVDHSSASGSKDVWLEAPTKLLLSLYQDLRPQVGKTFSLKNKTKMWQQIQWKLAEEGYTFSVTQVISKFWTLERRFKQTKLNNSESGRGKLTCPYEKELEDILGKNKAIQPEFVLDSDQVHNSQEEEEDEHNQTSSSASALESSTPRRKRGSLQEQLLGKLDKMEESRKEYRAKKLKLMEEHFKQIEKRTALIEKFVEKYGE